MDRQNELVNVRLAFTPLRADLARDLIVFFTLQVFERKIFQFPFYLGKAETVCKRRINIESFLRKALLFFGRELFQSAHIMQAVGKLDKHNPNIVHHGKQQLPIAFRLSHFMTFE